MTEHTCMHTCIRVVAVTSCHPFCSCSGVSPGDSIRHPAPFMWLVPKMDPQRGNWSAQMEEQQRTQKWLHGERYLTGTHMESHWLWGCWHNYHWGGSRPAARKPGGGEAIDRQEETVVRKRRMMPQRKWCWQNVLPKESLEIFHNIERMQMGSWSRPEKECDNWPGQLYNNSKGITV